MKFLNRLLIAALLTFSGAAIAATTPNSAITAQTPQGGGGVQNFVQGTDTAGTYKTVYTAGANGSMVKGIVITSNDASVAHLVTCQINNGTTGYTIGAVNVPVSSGYIAAAAPINFMAPANIPGLAIDNNGNPFFYLASGSTLKCTYATALTTSDLINVVATGADF